MQISFRILNKAHYKITKKSRNSKLKEKYYINEKTHLATGNDFVLLHCLKINKRRGRGGVLISSRGIRKKSTESKVISVPPFIRHIRVRGTKT